MPNSAINKRARLTKPKPVMLIANYRWYTQEGLFQMDDYARNDTFAVEERILYIRERKILLDTDLAALYGTTTKRLNQAVKRNRCRFPPDFVFRLNAEEMRELVTFCDRLHKIKYLSEPPFAFTEYGAIQAANVLNSARALEMSVLIVRTFVRMRELLATHEDLLLKIESLERRYGHQFKVVFDAIRTLIGPQDPPRKRIGF